MRMSMQPMQFLGLCCTECGQLLSKPEEAATQQEVIQVGMECGAVNPDNVTSSRCPKCGKVKLEEEAPQ